MLGTNKWQKKLPMLLDQKKNHKSSQNTNWVNISKWAQRAFFPPVYNKCLKINKNKVQQFTKHNCYEERFYKKIKQKWFLNIWKDTEPALISIN